MSTPNERLPGALVAAKRRKLVASIVAAPPTPNNNNNGSNSVTPRPAPAHSTTTTTTLLQPMPPPPPTLRRPVLPSQPTAMPTQPQPVKKSSISTTDSAANWKVSAYQEQQRKRQVEQQRQQSNVPYRRQAQVPLAAAAAAATTTTAKATAKKKPSVSSLEIESPFSIVNVAPPKSENDLWVDHYSPRTYDQIVGHNYERSILENWLTKERLIVGRPKVALVTGSAGIGKTTLVQLLLEHNGFQVDERNASSDRTVPKLIEIIRGTVMTHSFDETKPIALIIDECDGMFLGEVNHGGGDSIVSEVEHIEMLVEFIKSTLPRSCGPIVFIANETKPKQIRALSEIAVHVKMKKLRTNDLATIFRRIWSDRTTPASSATIDGAVTLRSHSATAAPDFIVNEFVTLADGDARRMIGQMQTFFSVYANESKKTALFNRGITSSVDLELRNAMALYRRVCSKDDFSNIFEAMRLAFFCSDTHSASAKAASASKHGSADVSTYATLFNSDVGLALGGVHTHYANFVRPDQIALVANDLSDADCIIGDNFPFHPFCVDAACIVAVGSARRHSLPLSSISPDIQFPSQYLHVRLSVNVLDVVVFERSHAAQRGDARSELGGLVTFRHLTELILSPMDSRDYREVWRKVHGNGHIAVDDVRLNSIPSRLRSGLVDYLQDYAPLGSGIEKRNQKNVQRQQQQQQNSGVVGHRGGGGGGFVHRGRGHNHLQFHRRFQPASNYRGKTAR